MFLLLFLGGNSAGAVTQQRTVFSADVVNSACRAVVAVDGGSGGRLLFGSYYKSMKTPVIPRDFTVYLYEHGVATPGCSALLLGQVVTLEFGNPGQLDASGVVTHGAGGRIRIDVRALDAQADFRATVTQKEHKVNYPVDFAAKGVFRFRAQPIMPKETMAGEYNGALAFVISYQ